MVYENAQKIYLAIKHWLNIGILQKDIAYQVLDNLGLKTELVALINGVNPLEVTDEMLDSY